MENGPLALFSTAMAPLTSTEQVMVVVEEEEEEEEMEGDSVHTDRSP